VVVGRDYTDRCLTSADVREALDALRDEGILVVPRAGEMLYRIKA
jgi:hypothetical protein